MAMSGPDERAEVPEGHEDLAESLGPGAVPAIPVGVHVYDSGPVRDAFVGLDGAVTVLYGLNGAGKTWILRGIAKACGQGGAVSADLHVRWPGTLRERIFHSGEGESWKPTPWNLRERIFQASQDVGIRHLQNTQGYVDHGRLVDRISSVIATALAGSEARGEGLSSSKKRFAHRFQLGDPQAQSAPVQLLRAVYESVFASVPLIVDGAVKDDDDDTLMGSLSRPDFLAIVLEALSEARFVIVNGQHVQRGRALEAPPSGATATHLNWLSELLREDESFSDLGELRDELIFSHGMTNEALAASMGWRTALLQSGGVVPPAWFTDTIGTAADRLAPVVRCVVEGDAGTADRELSALLHRAIEVLSSLGPLEFFAPYRSWGVWPDLDRAVQPPAANHRILVDGLDITAHPHLPSRGGDPPIADLLVDAGDGGVAPHPLLGPVAGTLTEHANRILSTLMPACPPLRCDIAPIHTWSSDGPLRWTAAAGTGDARLDLEALSAAQQRWSQFAIDVATASMNRVPGEAFIIVIDEPERALHRRAERELADGLTALAVDLQARLVVATHSPAFLAHPSADAYHVHRDRDGHTIADPLPLNFRNDVAELGLDPGDLLQLCRVLLIVEGQHELVVLPELLGDDLDRIGAELLCMRGATSLRSWDAQLLERFTDAPVVVLVDNIEAARLHEIWADALTAWENGEDHLPITRKMQRRSEPEGKFLMEFANSVLDAGTPHRYRITSLGKPDLPEYLDVHDIAPDVPAHYDWQLLRQHHADQVGETGKPTFKDWMQANYGAKYDDETLRSATQQVDRIHSDFTDLLEQLRYAASHRNTTGAAERT